MGSISNDSYELSMPPAIGPSSYPNPSEAALKLQLIGKRISDLQAPAAILDAAVVRKNCRLMNEAIKKLDVDFRCHVKSHKVTTEITKLQVGDTKSINLICSTVAEIENLLPWLLECKASGKSVNVLYGLPISLSQISRLARIVNVLGEGTVGIFADHPAHIKALEQVGESVWPGRIPVWVPIDVGDHREGVAANSKQLQDIANILKTCKRVDLGGIYAHHGSSYGSSSPEQALQYMAAELEGLKDGATMLLKTTVGSTNGARDAGVILSLGATPTATSIQNIQDGGEGAQRYLHMIDEIKKSFILEFHAGVYPLNDMQQMATRARPSHSLTDPTQSLHSYSDIAFRILVEVASLYPDREKPEALIAAGNIVLGREACKSYKGWAVVTPWPSTKGGGFYDPEGDKTGWIVGRISQEHGVLSWEGPRDEMRELRIGEKLLVWSNHACIAGVNFGWYCVVDSETDDAEIVRDVWVRWRGW